MTNHFFDPRKELDFVDKIIPYPLDGGENRVYSVFDDGAIYHLFHLLEPKSELDLGGALFSCSKLSFDHNHLSRYNFVGGVNPTELREYVEGDGFLSKSYLVRVVGGDRVHNLSHITHNNIVTGDQIVVAPVYRLDSKITIGEPDILRGVVCKISKIPDFRAYVKNVWRCDAERVDKVRKAIRSP